MPRTGLTSEELRARATDVALDRIRLVGFDKVRLSDVAKDIGVSHAALYAHFADKSALLDAVTERWLAHVEATGAAVAAGQGEPERRIVEWLVTLYQLERQRALTDPEPHRAFDLAAALSKPFVRSHLDSLIGQLTVLFSESRKLAGEPTQNAKLIYSATAAFHHPTLISQSAQHDREAELRQIVAVMLSGMASSPRER
ncbi:TetR/AcrR family transcriptional regulator [Rhizobium laguerreae]|uniref:TetR/AcrR family transcriptional regulator n=1 Tax=Rhizobium laguerreae TaxID=1076926 RepID=UPI001C9190F2|nr:TetR/AcrR family transcriptional regulator [Rhizobium laguerreae]MBY3465811.1 TetR/AcrR family transcriptional regulator [Rhizobium laguerreae]